MNKTLTLSACLAILGSLSAQSFTTPKGLEKVDGNYNFFCSTNRRFMSIDGTNTGTILLAKQFSMRRDKNGSSPGGAYTVDLTLNLGETSMGAVSTVMDENFTVNRTAAFPKKKFNWPDWSTPSSTPAPFDMVVPLAATFLYTGNNDLVWDLTLENGSVTTNLLDRDYTGALIGTSTALTTGCKGFSLACELISHGPAAPRYGMALRTGITGAPANVPVNLSMAVTDANATVPGFCATLHAVPLVIFPLGMSDANGAIPSSDLSVPFDATLNGFTLVSQAYAPDNGYISLSNGRSSLMPTNAATAGHDACYLWTSVGSLPNRSYIYRGGCFVAELKQ